MHVSLPPRCWLSVPYSCLYLFSYISIFIGGHSAGRSGLLSHGHGCARVLAVQILCVLGVVEEESKNIPLEIKIISVNRRQRVVFPVF